MNNKPKLPPSQTNRPMPVVYRHVLKCEWFRTFTFWQRLGILFGGGLVVQIGIATRHDPGPWQPLILGKVTKQMTPDAHHEEIINNMLEAKEKDPVTHEPKSKNSTN